MLHEEHCATVQFTVHRLTILASFYTSILLGWFPFRYPMRFLIVMHGAVVRLIAHNILYSIKPKFVSYFTASSKVIWLIMSVLYLRFTASSKALILITTNYMFNSIIDFFFIMCFCRMFECTKGVVDWFLSVRLTDLQFEANLQVDRMHLVVQLNAVTQLPEPKNSIPIYSCLRLLSSQGNRHISSVHQQFYVSIERNPYSFLTTLLREQMCTVNILHYHRLACPLRYNWLYTFASMTDFKIINISNFLKQQQINVLI
jgi:hypothetical protein